MVKFRKITQDTLNRFPCKEKILAFKALDYEVRRAVNITFDSAMEAALLYFAENGREDEIPAFVAFMQETIDTNAEHYDEAVAEGLNNQLHNLGIDYARWKNND